MVLNATPWYQSPVPSTDIKQLTATLSLVHVTFMSSSGLHSGSYHGLYYWHINVKGLFKKRKKKIVKIVGFMLYVFYPN